MKHIIYVDNAATTPVSPAVLEAMLPFYKEIYGNPSSVYSVGRKAKAPMEDARAKIARRLNAQANEIYFTSGGSEADNWAIKGTAHALLKKGKKHIITSKFEHHAVLHSCEALAKEGFDPVYGARPLRRAIQSQVEDLLSDAMLAGEVEKGKPATVDAVDGKVVIK